MILEIEVDAAAKMLAASPMIEAPKLDAISWHGLARAVLEAAGNARDGRPFKKYSLVRPTRAARDKGILLDCISGLVIEEPNDDGQVQIFWSELNGFAYVATEWLDEIRAVPAAI